VYTDLASRHVADHHWDKKRRQPLRPSPEQAFMVPFESGETTEPDSQQASIPLSTVRRQLQAGFLQGHCRTRNRELDKTIGALHVFFIEVIQGLELGDLSSNPARIVADIKALNGPDAALATQ
jgi:hypothetical protein